MIEKEGSGKVREEEEKKGVKREEIGKKSRDDLSGRKTKMGKREDKKNERKGNQDGEKDGEEE